MMVDGEPDFEAIAAYGLEDLGRSSVAAPPLEPERPDESERVEIQVDGKWIEARFVPGDYFPGSAGYEEVWWHDYFRDDNYNTYPPHIQSGGKLPPWRRKTGEA